MVVFFNDLTSFEDQLKWQQVFIEEIRKHLLQLQQEKPCKLKFEVQSSEEFHTCFSPKQGSACSPLMHESSFLFLCV